MVRTSFTTVQPLQQPQYESFDRITRCLHLDDVELSCRQQKLVPYKVQNTRALLRKKVLWFTPGYKEGHNFYGNVSFVVDWSAVLKHLGPNLYLIDQAIYGDRSYTRILITKDSYDGCLTNVDLGEDGSPIMKKAGKTVHAFRCLNKKYFSGPHEVQFGIEADHIEGVWLYKHSNVIANDHDSVNVSMTGQMKRTDGRTRKYMPFKCFKYNTSLNTQCPYQFRRTEAEKEIHLRYPQLSLSNAPKIFSHNDKENKPAVRKAITSPSRVTREISSTIYTDNEAILKFLERQHSNRKTSEYSNVVKPSKPQEQTFIRDDQGSNIPSSTNSMNHIKPTLSEQSSTSPCSTTAIKPTLYEQSSTSPCSTTAIKPTLYEQSSTSPCSTTAIKQKIPEQSGQINNMPCSRAMKHRPEPLADQNSNSLFSSEATNHRISAPANPSLNSTRSNRIITLTPSQVGQRSNSSASTNNLITPLSDEDIIVSNLPKNLSEEHWYYPLKTLLCCCFAR